MILGPQRGNRDSSSCTLQGAAVFHKRRYNQGCALWARGSQPKVNQFRCAVARQDLIDRYAQFTGETTHKASGHFLRIDCDGIQRFSKGSNGLWRRSKWIDIGAEIQHIPIIHIALTRERERSTTMI